MVFRVSVDLSHYFTDERARCFMLVPGGGGGGGVRRVSWLAGRLRRLFGARLAGCALLARGHLLPPGEPLQLLRPGDELRAVPALWSTEHCNDSDMTIENTFGISPITSRQLETMPSVEAFHETANICDNPPADEDVTDTGKIGLDEMKQHALAMLDALQPEPRRRRRARRRPQRQPNGIMPSDTVPPLPALDDHTVNSIPRSEIPSAETTMVIRNVGISCSAPRRVSALALSPRIAGASV